MLLRRRTAVAGTSLVATADRNLLTTTYNANAPITRYFPAGRLDYNVSQKLRAYLSFIASTATQQHGTYPAPFAGGSFANQDAGYFARDYISTLGVDYVFTPTLINQFKIGFTYAHNEYAYNIAPLYNTLPVVNFQFPGDVSGGNMSGLNYVLPSGNFYPLWSLSDTINVQRGAHSIQFGFSGYREQDHYYNPPVGFANLPLALATGDPALQALAQDTKTSSGTIPLASAAQVAEAQQLYAVLTGVSPPSAVPTPTASPTSPTPTVPGGTTSTSCRRPSPSLAKTPGAPPRT